MMKTNDNRFLAAWPWNINEQIRYELLVWEKKVSWQHFNIFENPQGVLCKDIFWGSILVDSYFYVALLSKYVVSNQCFNVIFMA